MAQILIPPCNAQMKVNPTKKSRVVAEGRVISGDEILKQLKEKEENARKLEEAKEERRKLKEFRKEQKERDIEERQHKKQKKTEEKERRERQKKDEQIRRAVCGRLANRKFTCGVCGERGRMNDELNGVMWYGCDESMCEKWYHEECLSMKERECLRESMEEKSDWYCGKCKPWLYQEE
ncbi:axoneme-associated protein mst101(2)-like [Ruditapes philippinarum]|nr:axoneme-associated protein mst101(2)-like [Ruditapes philippinarum]